MDKAKKRKVFIDLLMAAVFLLAMNIALTGILLHEVLGIALAVIIFVHLVLNRKWIAGITRNFFKSAKPAARAAYLFNILIAATTGLAILSGLLISQSLFPYLAAADIGLWYTVHAVSGWLAFFLLIVHTALHWRWIKGIFRQLAWQGASVKVLVSRAVAGLIASAAVYSIVANDSLYSLISPSVQNGVNAQTQQTAAASENAVSAPSGAAVTAAPAAGDQVTLEEFLGQLYCTACPRRCPLTNPQCAKGVRQAEEQTAAYYAQYGDQ